MVHFVIALAIWSVFLSPSHAGEFGIKDAGNAFDVTVTVHKTSHGKGATERLALNVAQGKLSSWLQTKNLQWPSEVRAEDHSFFLNLYQRSAAERAVFGRSELLRVGESVSRSQFTFRLFKSGIRVQPLQWSDIFAGIVNLTKQSDKISVLTHLELADRYPKDIPHGPVVQRIKTEIGVGFLKFITGADVTYAQTSGSFSSIPSKALPLAKMLHAHPYNIDISFVLIGKLRNTALRAVLCRIINQAQRGSKLSPAYLPIREFGQDACGTSASVFVNSISDEQIKEMRDEIDNSKLPSRGFAYDIVASFGEAPIILEARSATIAEKACQPEGLQACFQAFNRRPSVEMASLLAEMSAGDEHEFLAAAFSWQVWAWNGRPDALPKTKAASYPSIKIR